MSTSSIGDVFRLIMSVLERRAALDIALMVTTLAGRVHSVFEVENRVVFFKFVW